MAIKPGVRDPGTPTTSQDEVRWLAGRFNFLSVTWARARARGGPVNLTCYRCGDPGHTRSNCPRNALRVVSEPIPENRVPERRPEREVADAVAQAAAIRERMGWTRGGEARHTVDTRSLALAQVAASRATRELGGL